MRRGLRAVEGLEAGDDLLAEVEFLPASQHKIVLGVLANELALVGHE